MPGLSCKWLESGLGPVPAPCSERTVATICATACDGSARWKRCGGILQNEPMNRNRGACLGEKICEPRVFDRSLAYIPTRAIVGTCSYTGSLDEKEPVVALVTPTLSAAAPPVWVLPACLGALPKQGGWRRRCRGGGGCLEGVDNGGHWRQFDPGGQSV